MDGWKEIALKVLSVYLASTYALQSSITIGTKQKTRHSKSTRVRDSQLKCNFLEVELLALEFFLEEQNVCPIFNLG